MENLKRKTVLSLLSGSSKAPGPQGGRPSAGFAAVFPVAVHLLVAWAAALGGQGISGRRCGMSPPRDARKENVRKVRMSVTFLSGSVPSSGQAEVRFLAFCP